MILQALNQYYERLKDNPETKIPLFGFGSQKIHFVVVLNDDGQVVQVKDLREKVKNKTVPASITVPMIGKKRAVDITPNFMWDNTGYVLGWDAKGKDARTKKCFAAFKKLHQEIGKGISDRGLKAVIGFLESWHPEKDKFLEHWGEMSGANLVFQLDGELGIYP